MYRDNRRDNYNPYMQPYLSGDYAGNSVYQPVYDPNETARMADLLNKSQQRYDVGIGEFNEFQGQIGGMQTYDTNGLKNRTDEFTAKVQDVVKNQYNGDYGNAANEIAKMIAQEKANPFYKFNAAQVKAAETQREFKMKNPDNYYEFKNAQNVTSPEFLQQAMKNNDLSVFDNPNYGITPDTYDLAAKQLKNVNADSYEELISELDTKDIQKLKDAGIDSVEKLFQSKISTGISQAKLDKLANSMAESMLNQTPYFMNKYGNKEEAKKEALDVVKQANPQFTFNQSKRDLIDLTPSKSGSDSDKVSPYDASAVLPVNSSEYDKANSQYEEITAFDYSKEPASKTDIRTRQGSSGSTFEYTAPNADWEKWNKSKEKFETTFNDEVTPFFTKMGNLGFSKEEFDKLPEAEKNAAKQAITKTYLETKRNMASSQEGFKTISYEAMTNINKLKDQQLSTVDNFIVDGKTVGWDGLKKELGSKRMTNKELFDNLNIAGKDSQGRFVAKYRDGNDEKIVRFYPTEEAKRAFSPVKKIMDNYNVKNSNPMKFTENGKTWLVDYVFDGEKVIPRVIKGNSEEIDAINDKDPKAISNYISKIQQTTPEYIFDLESISNDTYNTYNSFYNTYTGKK